MPRSYIPSTHPSSSSSSDSLPVHSSGLDAPDETYSGSSTRDVSPRLGYPSKRTPQRSEAFCRWCAALLSTLIVGIETVQRWLEADQLIAMGERVLIRLSGLRVFRDGIERDRVNNLRLHMSLSHEEFRQVRRDHDDTQGRLRRLESTMTITRSGMTLEAIEELINRRVEEALAAHEATRAVIALETENQS
ncbi:hypothetical protein Tco_1458841 [Tanacetum coccineum]